MSVAFRLRAAAESDADDLAALHAAAFDRPWPAGDFAAWLTRPDAFAVLLDADGAPAGFALALVSGEDAELLTIAVAPGRRCEGAGRALLRAIDAEAGRRGLVRWVLEVARNNLPALALYSRDGFVEIGVRKGYYPDPAGPVDAIMLARPAGRAGGHGGA